DSATHWSTVIACTPMPVRKGTTPTSSACSSTSSCEARDATEISPPPMHTDVVRDRAFGIRCEGYPRGGFRITLHRSAPDRAYSWRCSGGCAKGRRVPRLPWCGSSGGADVSALGRSAPRLSLPSAGLVQNSRSQRPLLLSVPHAFASGEFDRCGHARSGHLFCGADADGPGCSGGTGCGGR